MSFIQGKTVHGGGGGEYSASPAAELSSEGIWGKNKFSRMLEKAIQKQGMIGSVGGRGFL